MTGNLGSGILYFFMIALLSCTSEDKAFSGLENIFRKEVITPATAGRIYLGPVVNKTDNPGLSDEIITRLKNRISFEGRFVVVNEPGQGDIEMDLEIFLFTLQPVKFDTSGNQIQEKMRALVSVTIFNSKNGNVILKGKEIEAILVFSEIIPPVMDMYSATASLADMLSERILSVLMTGWYKKGVIPSKRE